MIIQTLQAKTRRGWVASLRQAQQFVPVQKREMLSAAAQQLLTDIATGRMRYAVHLQQRQQNTRLPASSGIIAAGRQLQLPCTALLIPLP